jgi:dynein heavy chain
MKANLHRALENFNHEILETVSKETEFKAILFALCYFHAVVTQRRKFGSQGWNRTYPFNSGDLSISVNILYNYLESSSNMKVIPWENLIYLFGDIMYGGHITDDWDRRLCRSYLEKYMDPLMLKGELYLAPGVPVPISIDFKMFHSYVDEHISSDNTYLYGLHPNAEIDFLTTSALNVFRIVFEMQPKELVASGAGNDFAQMKDDLVS